MLTEPQYNAISNAIRTSTDPAVIAARVARDDMTCHAWINGVSAFVVYKSKATVMDVWRVFLLSDVANLTTANTNRLQVMRDIGTFDPARADHRDGVENVFGLSGTKTALAAFWKRVATRAEQVFAAGTGTDAAPGALVFEGTVSLTDVSLALTKYPGA